MESLVLNVYSDRAFLYRESAGDFDPEARFMLSTYDGKWEAEIWSPDFTEDMLEPTQTRTFNRWHDVLLFCENLAYWFGIDFKLEYL